MSDSFIHSGCFYSASSTPLLLRGTPDTAQTVLEFHAKVPQATVSEGLAQGPYVAARAGVKPMTLQTNGIDSTSATNADVTVTQPTISARMLVTVFHVIRTTVAIAVFLIQNSISHKAEHQPLSLTSIAWHRTLQTPQTMPVNKLVSLTWLLWALKSFWRFTLHYTNCLKLTDNFADPCSENMTNNMTLI